MCPKLLFEILFFLFVPFAVCMLDYYYGARLKEWGTTNIIMKLRNVIIGIMIIVEIYKYIVVFCVSYRYPGGQTYGRASKQASKQAGGSTASFCAVKKKKWCALHKRAWKSWNRKRKMYTKSRRFIKIWMIIWFGFFVLCGCCFIIFIVVQQWKEKKN